MKSNYSLVFGLSGGGEAAAGKTKKNSPFWGEFQYIKADMLISICNIQA